ncbi:MAG TPA: prepilin-type N-terminal cleavage/methylation domain-containing protein [Polyangiales bacterium]|jgi:prepilin-type N-terminal cleavage/methylation domain-containing protein|nr:prepilin-type N-terminal cleavage/methylation domain-containing protein [Polyangiales bacterium]
MSRPSVHGFTLIELMLVVAIMGVLSAIALPAFSKMVARSKTAETAANLDSMFKSAASYYTGERAGQGQVSSTAGHCTIGDAGPAPVIPKKDKQPFPVDDNFRALGFGIGDLVYFSYGLASGSGTSVCDNGPHNASLYTFYANGDLDGDGTFSTFELATGSDSTNVLYHARGFYVIDDLE